MRCGGRGARAPFLPGAGTGTRRKQVNNLAAPASNTLRSEEMRRIIASEFMTLDGVIQNEENDGDSFKYGGWFFPYADEVTGGRGTRAAGEAHGSAVGRKTFDG